jgi:hypothetical protein
MNSDNGVMLTGALDSLKGVRLLGTILCARGCKHITVDCKAQIRLTPYVGVFVPRTPHGCPFFLHLYHILSSSSTPSSLPSEFTLLSISPSDVDQSYLSL